MLTLRLSLNVNGQTGEKAWFTGQQYEMAPTMSVDNRTFVNALLNGEVNATQNLALTQGNVYSAGSRQESFHN